MHKISPLLIIIAFCLAYQSSSAQNVTFELLTGKRFNKTWSSDELLRNHSSRYLEKEQPFFNTVELGVLKEINNTWSYRIGMGFHYEKMTRPFFLDDLHNASHSSVSFLFGSDQYDMSYRRITAINSVRMQYFLSDKKIRPFSQLGIMHTYLFSSKSYNRTTGIKSDDIGVSEYSFINRSQFFLSSAFGILIRANEHLGITLAVNTDIELKRKRYEEYDGRSLESKFGLQMGIRYTLKPKLLHEASR